MSSVGNNGLGTKCCKEIEAVEVFTNKKTCFLILVFFNFSVFAETVDN